MNDRTLGFTKEDLDRLRIPPLLQEATDPRTDGQRRGNPPKARAKMSA